MIKRALTGFAALGALLAAAMVVVVALAMTLYAAVLPFVGPAWAAASVALAAALIAVIAALVIAAQVKGPKVTPKPDAELGPMDRVMRMVGDKPIYAVAALIGAGLFAFRNPALVGALVRGFFESRNSQRP